MTYIISLVDIILIFLLYSIRHFSPVPYAIYTPIWYEDIIKYNNLREVIKIYNIAKPFKYSLKFLFKRCSVQIIRGALVDVISTLTNSLFTKESPYFTTFLATYTPQKLRVRHLYAN